MHERARLCARVPARDQLNETGLQPEFIEILRTQSRERFTQCRHHSAGDARDGARVLGEIRAIRARARFNRRRESH